jgi:hypothetical protein
MTWVKGHYNGHDHHFKYQLNKIAHKAAVTFLKNPHPDFTPHPVPLLTPTHTVSISHNNLILTSHPSQTILRELHKNPIKEKMLKNNKWSKLTLSKLHWDAFRLAMSSISRCHQVSICKLMNGLWNTNEQNHRYYGTPNHCPYCSLPESLVHVFTCNSPQATSHRQEAIKTFQGALEKLKTTSKILETIISGLSHWVQSINTSAPIKSAPFRGSLNTLEILLTKAFAEQNTDKGWVPLLQGKISKYWIEAYTASLPKSPQTTKRALLWGKKVILALWSLSKTIWKQRNKEIHGHSMQETRAKKGQKLEKQAMYFYNAYKENPLLYYRETDTYLIMNWTNIYSCPTSTKQHGSDQ